MIDLDARTVTARDGVLVREGEVVSVDGTTGLVALGALPVLPSPVVDALAAGTGAGAADPVSAAVLTLLRHADARATVAVRANADTASDLTLARRLGAVGVGLARTEHMMMGERRRVIEEFVLGDRAAGLADLERIHHDDLTALLRAADGLPVVVRLLDPPLHEFLPDLTALTVEVETARLAGTLTPEAAERLAAVRRWHESDPMLGLRGVRLAAVVPDLVRAQVRALVDAVLDLRAEGGHPRAELLVPLVADVAELRLVRTMVEHEVSAQADARGEEAPQIPVGTMIELPRAALTAAALAAECDFFSFGTNDLTQTTWGMSRDDAEAAFLPAYRLAGLLPSDPFVHLDVEGVGRLVEIAAVAGRAARPELGLGVCGEHGGDPESVRYLAGLGVDYVSCSPWRVPVARLEVGRAALPGGSGG